MRSLRLEGAVRGKLVRTTLADRPAPCPLDRLNRRRGPWRGFEAVEFAMLQWVDWFNNRRLLEPIGNILPAEAEARYHAQSNERSRVA